MAGAIGAKRATAKSLAPDLFERALALGAIALLLAVAAALWRGRAHWPAVPPAVWLHLLTILVALALTPSMLLRRRGDRWHRRLGTLWVAAMIATALGSFAMRYANQGGLSIIHLLSFWVLIQAPLIWWSARTHRVAMHRGAVRGMVTGALLIAGFFTFPFNRMLGAWLFG